jgi:hypothetical protein
MADLPNREKGRVVVEDGPTGTDLKVNSDGSINVIAASAGGVGGVTLIRNYARVTVNAHPTTLTTYTVPTGKVLDIELWHLNTAGAITLTAFQVAGVERDSLRFNNSGDTNRLEATFGVNTPIRATAGQVVRIITVSGDTGKEFIAGFNAIERNA